MSWQWFVVFTPKEEKVFEYERDGDEKLNVVAIVDIVRAHAQ